MRMTCLLHALLFCAAAMASNVYAQQLMFDPAHESVDDVTIEKNKVRKAASFASVKNAARFKRKLMGSMLSDDEYILDMPSKAVRVRRMRSPEKASYKGRRFSLSQEYESFPFVDGSGGLTFVKQGGKLVSARIQDISTKQIYTGEVSAEGVIEFVEQDIHSLLCVSYPKEDYIVPAKGANVHSDKTLAKIEVEEDPEALTEVEVRNLQSRSDSQKVLFIDYWGGTVSGTAWNVNYTGGADIIYQPYNTEGASSTFTAGELHKMYSAWAETAEDYAPFDINVTTDIDVYNATPANRRVKIIATPTEAWFVNVEGFAAGGVAYVDVFGSNSDYYTVGWSWNDTFSSMGMTHSHESGHQMGLSHDGQLAPAREYYSGQGNWGPIMGGPFGLDYVQWSNGQYTNANETEDDLTIIENALSFVADDVPNNTAQATPIDVANADFIGQITPQGVLVDTDVLVIQQGVTSTVNVLVRPLFEGNNSTGTGANLSMRARFFDSSDVTIAEIAPTGDPTTNVLNYSGSLSPGTYYISVTNESYNTNLSVGFNEYGNGGYYQVSVNGGFSDPNPDLTIDSAQITPNSIPINSSDDIVLSGQVRNIGFDTATQYSITYYQSDDQVINNSDVVLNSSTINTSLATSEVSAVLQHQFQPPQDAGTYYYGLCVSAVSPSETNANNNCSVAQRLTVSDEFCFVIKAANGNVATVCL